MKLSYGSKINFGGDLHATRSRIGRRLIKCSNSWLNSETEHAKVSSSVNTAKRVK